MVYLRGIIMKSKTLKLFTLPLLFILSGCNTISGNGTFIACVSNETGNGFSKRYSSFDGTYNYAKKFSKAQAFLVDIKTTDGTITLAVKNTENSENIYTGNFDKDTEITSFTINAEAGKYEFSFSAVKHSGSFEVKFTDKE